MSERFNVTFDFEGKASSLISEIDKIKKSFNGLNLPNNLGKEAIESFKNVGEKLEELKKKAAGGFQNQREINEFKKEYQDLSNTIETLGKQFNKIKNTKGASFLSKADVENFDKLKEDTKDLNNYFKDLTKTQTNVNNQLKETQKLLKQQKTYQIELSKSQEAADVKNLRTKNEEYADSIKSKESYIKGRQTLQSKTIEGSDEYNKLQETINKTQASIDELTQKMEANQKVIDAYDDKVKLVNSQISNSQEEFGELTNKLSSINDAIHDTSKIDLLRQHISEIANEDISKIPTDLSEISKYLDNLPVEKGEQLKQSILGAGIDLENVNKELGNFGKEVEGIQGTADEMSRVNKELDSLSYKTQYFFGLTNGINLFRRAIRSAFETVKELDAAMTEMAVVTDLGVGDYWEQLPDYTRRANELGVATKDVYEAATLYYQQGLNTEQVTALTTSTLKMARIASLDAAEATDRELLCHAA